MRSPDPHSKSRGEGVQGAMAGGRAGSCAKDSKAELFIMVVMICNDFWEVAMTELAQGFGRELGVLQAVKRYRLL